MNSREFIARMSEQSGLSPKLCRSILKIYCKTVIDSMNRGERVVMTGFGIFQPVIRPAHQGCNPKNGTLIDIPERRAMRFVPSKVLRKSLSQEWEKNKAGR